MNALFLFGVLIVAQVAGQDIPAPPVERVADVSQLHVVLIDGINKDPEEIRSKDRNVQRLAQHFRNAGVPGPQLHVLAPADSFVADATGPSDAATIRATLTALRGLGPTDRLVLYYTGQANLVGDQLRFNVPGPDFTHSDLAAMLADLHPGLLVVILDSPGAGIAAKVIAAPNRILVFGARSDQPTSTRFSDYFVPALDDPESDENGDGRISMVEAFQRTVHQIDNLFRDQSLMKSETALLDDNGDGEPTQRPWMHATEGNDGAVASNLMLDCWNLIPRQEITPNGPSTDAREVTPLVPPSWGDQGG